MILFYVILFYDFAVKYDLNFYSHIFVQYNNFC